MTPHHQPDEPPLPAGYLAALDRYSHREQGRGFRPPDGFAARVVRRYETRLWRIRWAKRVTIAAVGILTVAACGHLLSQDTPPPAVIGPEPARQVPPPPNLSESLSEVGEAWASISRDTAEKATGPTRSLFSTAERWRVPDTKAGVPDVSPAAESFASVPAAARSSLEPLTDSTRRAINLFLRDTGLQSAN